MTHLAILVVLFVLGDGLSFYAGYLVGVHHERFKPRTLTEAMNRAQRQRLRDRARARLDDRS